MEDTGIIKVNLKELLNNSDSEIYAYKELSIKMTGTLSVTNLSNNIKLGYVNSDTNFHEEITFQLNWEEFLCSVYNDLSLSIMKSFSSDWLLLVYNGKILKSIFELELDPLMDIIAKDITPSSTMMGLLNNIKGEQNV